MAKKEEINLIDTFGEFKELKTLTEARSSAYSKSHSAV